MKKMFCLFCLPLVLSACGVEVLTGAATSAVLKKEEMQVRKQQKNQIEQRLEEAQQNRAVKDQAARDALGLPPTNDAFEER